MPYASLLRAVMFGLPIFPAYQRSVDIRSLSVPAEICSSCLSATSRPTHFGIHADAIANPAEQAWLPRMRLGQMDQAISRRSATHKLTNLA